MNAIDFLWPFFVSRHWQYSLIFQQEAFARQTRPGLGSSVRLTNATVVEQYRQLGNLVSYVTIGLQPDEPPDLNRRKTHADA